MNLFQNILDNAILKDPTKQFLSGFQDQSSTQTPKTPQQKPKMNLFSDEYTMLGKMKADGVDDERATQMIKKRRADLLGGDTKLSPDEQSMLLKMQADNISAKEATAFIQKRRKDQFEKKYQEGSFLQKGAYNALMFGAGNAEKVLKYGGNILDFATLGMAGFGEDVKRMEQVTQSPEFDSTARKVGSYLPDVALGVSPIGGAYLAGAKGMGNLALRSGVVGAGFGATQPILEQGSDATMGDIATGGVVGAGIGAVATPVISKVIKYGQAGYYGGLEGAGKSIARDIKGGINAITPSGANISTRANRFNAQEIRDFRKMTGESPGEFATSRGMTKTGDDAVVEATRLWQASKDQADEGLKAIKGRFKVTGEEDVLESMINDLDTRLTNTLSPDANRLKKLRAKYEDGGLTMSEINEVKRLYSQNHKYSFVDVGSEAAIRSRNLQDRLRKWQFKVAEENGLTNLKEINKTTQGWKAFADSLSKKIQGSSGNNAVSLTDWVALSGASPENIALYLGKKIASSDKVKRGAIKLFSKQTKPSIIKASIPDIQKSNFQKNVNRGVSGAGDNSGGKSLVRVKGLLPAGSKEAIKEQEEAIARQQAKKLSTEQAKKRIKAEEARKEAIKTPDITSKSKIVRPSAKPSPQVKPVEKTVKPTEKKIETNITRNEAIEKGFSDSAKARWDKGDFTMKERVEATKYLKSNYKGKEYMIDGKKYKVDAIDNRNEQVRLVDSEGNIIRVKINKLPETKVTDKDIFDYYNGRIQKGYKTILSPTEKVLTPKKQSATMGDMETKKLIEEARKYKSAEEFEKALRSPRGIGYGGNMGILWRATSKPYKPNTKTIIEHGITDSGNTKSYAKDILLSNDYGKSEPYIISKDAKIASWSEGNDVYKTTKESAFSKKSIEEFKRRGFDGFSRGPDEIVIFNHEKINPFNIKDFFTNYIKGVESHKPFSPQKTVKPKNLTEGKQSATMGDMETKKLIEEARKTPVYHGTNVEFREFDPKRINTVESSGDYIGEGFYFTTSKESAKKYAQQAVKKNGGKEVIKEVTLDMKKPFIINSKSDIQKLNDIFGGEDNRIELLLDNPKAIREKLQSLGYDGLIDNLYGQRAVFNEKQIISK